MERWLKEAFGGADFKTLKINQQMAPQCLPLWEKKIFELINERNMYMF
jgi:hypothetical protein